MTTAKNWNAALARVTAEHGFGDTNCVLHMLKPMVSDQADSLIDFDQRVVFIDSTASMDDVIRTARELVADNLKEISDSPTWASHLNLLKSLVDFDGAVDLADIYQYMVDRELAPSSYQECECSMDLVITFLIEANSGYNRFQRDELEAFLENTVAAVPQNDCAVAAYSILRKALIQPRNVIPRAMLGGRYVLVRDKSLFGLIEGHSA